MRIETAKGNIEFAIKQCCDHHYGIYNCADACFKKRGQCRAALRFLLEAAKKQDGEKKNE